MSELSENSVREVLKKVKYPGFSRDIVSFGLVKEIRIADGMVDVQMVLSTNDMRIPQQIREEAEEVVRSIPGAKEVRVKIDVQSPAQVAGGVGPTKIPGVKHVIAVASGKGGVGKSTVAANLAVSLARLGAKTGLCDCDIYGPSIALMFGSRERPYADEENRIIPVEQYDVQFMSMGLLLEDTSPAILRGPMVTRYTQQFLRQVAWSNLDYLVLDLPPGTGDIQLTIVQTVALEGAIVVTTPQEVALIDARKAVSMFEKTSVEVLGIVENMSYFVCPDTGKRYDIFGSGGGQREATRLKVPLLSEIPIEIAIREGGDIGRPIVEERPESKSAQCFLRLAQAVREHVGC